MLSFSYFPYREYALALARVLDYVRQSPECTTCRQILTSGRAFQMSATGKTLGGAGRTVDDRFGGGKWGITVMRKAFPDHWSFLLGEIAMYSFVVLLMSGIFLTLFFKPGMTEIPYHGSYTRLDGVQMSEAYASTLHISFDVRGGLLVRQIHHWSAVLFIGAILVHMLRHFFTGSYRKPREISWLIGMLLMILAFAEGFAGYSLPD